MKRLSLVGFCFCLLAFAAFGQPPVKPAPVYRPSAAPPVYQPQIAPSPSPSSSPNTKPPVYLVSDNLTVISQVTDVSSKDSYYKDLKALIEDHRVQSLTSQYRFRGADNLTPNELNDLTSKSQIAVMGIANRRPVSPDKYKALFGKGCSGPMGKNGVLTEAESLGFVQCRFALPDLKSNSPMAVTSRGRLTTFLNTAIVGWLKKLDALK